MADPPSLRRLARRSLPRAGQGCLIEPLNSQVRDAGEPQDTQHGRSPRNPCRAACGGQALEFCRMTRDQLQARSKTDLAALARRKGIAGWHAMRKEDLVEALAATNGKPKARKAKPARHSRHARNGRPSRPRPRAQTAAARNTNGPSAEEQVERSKYDVGVPTK